MTRSTRMLRAALSWLASAARLQVLAYGLWPHGLAEVAEPERELAAGLPPGHPERLSGLPLSAVEAELWAQLTGPWRPLNG